MDYDTIVEALEFIGPRDKVRLLVAEDLLTDALAIAGHIPSPAADVGQRVLPGISVEVNNLLPPGQWFLL